MSRQQRFLLNKVHTTAISLRILNDLDTSFAATASGYDKSYYCCYHSHHSSHHSLRFDTACFVVIITECDDAVVAIRSKIPLSKDHTITNFKEKLIGDDYYFVTDDDYSVVDEVDVDFNVSAAIAAIAAINDETFKIIHSNCMSSLFYTLKLVPHDIDT